MRLDVNVDGWHIVSGIDGLKMFRMDCLLDVLDLTNVWPFDWLGWRVTCAMWFFVVSGLSWTYESAITVSVCSNG
uniref:Neur_chan_LBD domain-containing protein n=1 Tax=Panagrellus redivivus TaxID=6233 RepID=A0A7E4VZS2_PANRE